MTKPKSLAIFIPPVFLTMSGWLLAFVCSLIKLSLASNSYNVLTPFNSMKPIAESDSNYSSTEIALIQADSLSSLSEKSSLTASESRQMVKPSMKYCVSSLGRIENRNKANPRLMQTEIDTWESYEQTQSTPNLAGIVPPLPKAEIDKKVINALIIDISEISASLQTSIHELKHSRVALDFITSISIDNCHELSNMPPLLFEALVTYQTAKENYSLTKPRCGWSIKRYFQNIFYKKETSPHDAYFLARDQLSICLAITKRHLTVKIQSRIKELEGDIEDMMNILVKKNSFLVKKSGILPTDMAQTASEFNLRIIAPLMDIKMENQEDDECISEGIINSQLRLKINEELKERKESDLGFMQRRDELRSGKTEYTVSYTIPIILGALATACISIGIYMLKLDVFNLKSVS